MLMSIAALSLAIQAVATPPAPTPISVEAQNEPRLQTAAQLLKDRQPQAALDVLTIALAAYDADHAGEKRRLYCGMSLQESILYSGMAAKDKVGAVVLPPGYCTALYLKGYALVDLGRIAEAKAIYQQVIALAPLYAQYQTELGQLVRLDKDWPRMLSICEQAGQAAALAPPDIKPLQQTAALRCQGYALVEEHKLGDAEKRYREALRIDPNDRKAEGELRYIAQQRAKR